jgi:hypothetical protein
MCLTGVQEVISSLADLIIPVQLMSLLIIRPYQPVSPLEVSPHVAVIAYQVIAGAGRCLFTAQSKPDLVVRNSESLAYLGLTIFLSQFGNDFSTGLARGLGAPQAAPAPGTTDPGYKVPSQQPENPPPKKRSGKGGKKPSNNPPRLKGRQTTEPSGSGRYLEIAKIRRVFQA